MMCCTLLFYPTQQDPTHLTKVALGNLDAAIAQLGKRQTKDMKVPGSTPGLIICPLSACEVRRERRSHSPSSSKAAYKDDLPRIRSWNLRLWRPTPYPLGANRPSVALFQAEAIAKAKAKASKSSWCRIMDLRLHS